MSAPHQPVRVAFLFTGQGSQYPGMASGLYAAHPVARRTLDRCEEAFRALYGESLLDVLLATDPSDTTIHETAWTQPGLYALEMALAAAWVACGLTPAAVLGHSIGEFAAATIAGVCSLRDGLALAGARGRMMQRLPRTGGMLAVRADCQAVEARLSRYPELDIAAVNGPTAVVVSGALAQIEQLEGELEDEEIACKRVNVSHAFHSRLMAPMLDEFRSFASARPFGPPNVTFISTLHGRALAAGERLDAEYWTQHIHRPVRFTDAVQALSQLGIAHWLEVGPDGTLLSAARKTVREGYSGWASLKSGMPARETLEGVADGLRAAGLRVALNLAPSLSVATAVASPASESLGGAQ